MDATRSCIPPSRIGRLTLPGAFTVEALRAIASLSPAQRAEREAQRHIETDRITRKTP